MSLTDEQIKEVWRSVKDTGRYMHDAITFARAIESAACAERDKRIAEMEEMNAQLREQNTAVDKACADLEAHIEQLERELKTERAVSFRDQVAQLEQRNRDLYEDVKRFRAHALNEKDARMALERELEIVRKDAERYRWLRNTSQISASYTGRGVAVPHYTTNETHRCELDAAIDAAKEKP